MKRIAIITGASSGIGEEFTRQVCAKYDFDEIWIIARREEKLQSLAEELNKTKNFNCIRPVVMDVAGKAGVESLKNFLAEEDENVTVQQRALQLLAYQFRETVDSHIHPHIVLADIILPVFL